MAPPQPISVSVKRLSPNGLPLPQYETPGAAGMDLRASLEQELRVEVGARVAVPTGIAFEIPPGYEGQVRPRSGLAIRQGLTVLNAPGTVDSDYRGEVKVLLVNLGQEPITLRHGDRIAQVVFAPVVRAELVEVAELNSSNRGAGGFGHTGIS